MPRRFLEEPAPAGPAKGHVVELVPLLREYYELRGWDFETGYPTREALTEVGLDDIVDYLAKIGKLA